eukprot:gene32222-41765_t
MSEEDHPTENVSGKRERKKPEHFSASLTTKTAKKDVTYQGTGTQLVENEAFCRHLDKHKGDDEVIKLIHRLLFGTEGRKAEAKKNIRKFSGFSPGTVQADIIEKVSTKKAWTVTLLKSFAEMLGLEKSGAREAIIERIVEFLMSPGLAPAKKGSGQKRPRSTEKSSKAKKAKVVEDEEEDNGEEEEEEEKVEEDKKEEDDEPKDEEPKDEEPKDEEPAEEEVKEKPKAKASKAKKAPKVEAKKETKKEPKKEKAAKKEKGSKKSKDKKGEAKEDEDEEKAAAAEEEEEVEQPVAVAAAEDKEGAEADDEDAAPAEETV